MKTKKLNRVFLEEVLKQRIEQIYSQQLKQEPKEIKVYFSEQNIIVIIEGIVTKTEIFLQENSQHFLAKQVRSVLNRFIKSELKILIEEAMKVTVVDLLFKAKVDTDRLGAIVIFDIESNSVV
ncbi:DUF2294 domain-containing protein [Gloeothece verrucosa]|uniref:Na+-translocating membrane potential-generating system MpsC domain-containing protein n=1 Tax=Gloeothece verrucosa (strain PCC 7822) TaxID=497965 RepID=E0UIK9_GLOV7|nr:DUF2294 domain-containing protein [Gloeothece verrucosa]ADN12203.1 Protein of unknown function DUF2294 [Gloeothece verrucosa PCC 7822]